MKLLSKGLISTGIISIMLCLGSAKQFAHATTAEDYERALSAYNQNNYDEAYIHLKNSLQKDPENLAAKILMGRILLMNGYLSAAELEFTEALEMGADFNLIAEPLGNTLLFMNRYNDVLTFSKTDTLTGAAKQSWQLIRASACIRLDNFSCAQEAYQNVLNNNTKSIDAINGLASVALQQKDLNLANDYIERAMTLNNANPVTWRLKGQLAYQQNDPDAAMAHLQKALSLNKDDPIALRNLVDLYLKAQNFEQAKLFVDQIISDTPNDPLAILLSTWLESRQEGRLIENEKLKELNAFVSQLPPELLASQPMLRYISGLANFFNNNMESAAEDFSAYLQQEPDDIQAVMMLSQVYMSTQQYKRALQLLEKHQTELLGDLEAGLLLGDLMLRNNRAFKAERLLEALQKRHGNNSKLALFEIKLLAASGRLEDALTILDNGFESYNQNPLYLFTYALIKLQAGALDDALNASNLLLKLMPNDAEILNLRTGILIRQDRLNEAKESVKQALAIKPNLFAAQFNQAAIHARLGELDMATPIIDELLTLSPNHTQSVLLKAYVETRQGNIDNAIQRYKDLLTLKPDTQSARERLATLYSERGQLDDALYQYERLLKDNFDNPDYLLAKADLQIRLDHTKEALKTLGIVENFIQDSPGALMRFGELNLAVNQQENALKAMASAHGLAPDNARIAATYARTLIGVNKLKEASIVLKSMRSSSGESADYWALNGELFTAKAQHSEAVDAYLKALERDPFYARPLLALYNYALREQFVNVFLDKANTLSQPEVNNLLARNLLAQYLFFTQDYDQAKPMYLALLEEETVLNPSQIYNRLAVMTIDSSLSDALNYIEKAYELTPSDADILDTYGWIQALSGNYNEALTLLREAYTRDVNDPNIRYHLGYTLAKLGRISEAKEELNYAVNVERPFFKRPQAKALLNELE